MRMLFDDITKTIGNTPLVRLNRITKGLGGTVLAKVESFNPMSSVKDRIGVAMIDAAEADGLIKQDTIILEATSGNTGIALALVAAARGYRFTLVMPETMSIERRKLVKAFGAELVLTPGNEGMKGAVAKAEQCCKKTRSTSTSPSSSGTRRIPRSTGRPPQRRSGAIRTGRSILSSQGSVPEERSPVLQSVIKSRKPSFRAIAVEPDASPVLSGGSPGPHKIQGIGAGFVPDVLQRDLVDEMIRVTNEDAIATARRSQERRGSLPGYLQRCSDLGGTAGCGT